MTNKTILIIITLIAFFLRIYQNNLNPLLWDEASIGYNAYSIIKTGKDEHGTKFPLIFKSFGDYKPGLYIYLTIPFIADLGLTPIAVRLPSILIGSLTPLFLYLLITALSPKSSKIALFTSALLAFNPYNIHFSRGAWETNILTFELILASYLFIKNKYLISSIIFGLTLYTYQGGKIMSPIIIFSLLLLYRISIKKIISFTLPYLIFSIPIIIGLISGNDSNRLKVFSLFSYPQNPQDISQIISESNLTDYTLFHNRFIYFSQGFFERYFNNFSARFLIFEGDWQSARHNAPYIGFFLYPSLIFFYFGIFHKLAFKFNKITKFFLIWLLLAPLSSALSRDSIQPVRDMSFSIPFLYFTGYGLFTILKKYQLLSGLIIFIYILSFVYYSDLYLNHLYKVKPKENLYGYSEASQYLISNYSDKKDIYFTDFYGQPYIYYLFYSKYDPATFQKQANLITTSFDTGKITKIDNIHFETPDFNSLKTKPQQLLIFSHDDVLRQGIDLNLLTPISPVNTFSTFYGYQTN